MRPRPLLLLSTTVAVTLSACAVDGPKATASDVGSWLVRAEMAECCSCNPICPCIVGSPATLGSCEGSRLIEIEEGRYGDVELDGLSVVAVFKMGAWVKYYVDDRATAAQVEAAGKLVSAAIPSFADWGVVSTRPAALTVERAEGSIAFSVADAAVEMSVMRGRGGKPIRVENTSLADYVQHVGSVNRHVGGTDSFEYTGTSGFTATLAADG